MWEYRHRQNRSNVTQMKIIGLEVISRMRAKEDKSDHKISSLIDLNDYSVEHNKPPFFFIWICLVEDIRGLSSWI